MTPGASWFRQFGRGGIFIMRPRPRPRAPITSPSTSPITSPRTSLPSTSCPTTSKCAMFVFSYKKRGWIDLRGDAAHLRSDITLHFASDFARRADLVTGDDSGSDGDVAHDAAP